MWKHLSYRQFKDFFGDLGLTAWVKYNWLAQVGQNIGLPKEYQQVEYLKSNGGQYIKTGLIPSNATSIRYQSKIEILEYSNNGTIYGSFNTSGVKMAATLFLYENNFGIGTDGPTFKYFKAFNANTNEFDIKVFNTNLSIKMNNEVFDYDVTGASSDYEIILFGVNNAGNVSKYSEPSKIYYFIITIDGEVKRRMIPCYRKTDNVAGMFDLVNQQFYTNAGSGTFIVGDDI